MLKTKIENIPEELKAQRIWAVSKNGIPTNPFTHKGCTNNDMFEFEEVVKNVGNYEYLAFHIDSPMKMGFLDLDAHTDEEEKILQQLLNFFKLNFNSYMEVSKSGKGYHLLVKTDITKKYRINANPINNNSRMPIEFYTSGKWCTITGDLVDDRKELLNDDNSLQQVLNRFFTEREEIVSKGISEGEKIRDNQEVINLIEGDRFLSKLWNNNISNITTRRGEVVSYNNHTADYILIRGIMYYCNANKEQAREIFKLSPKYNAYPFGYKRETDITHAIEDSLKTLDSVMKTKEELIAEKCNETVEERQEKLEDYLTGLSEKEQEVMEQVDKLLDITEEDKLNISATSVDVRKIKPYLAKIKNLKLKDCVSIYIRKKENIKEYTVNFIENSDLYTTTIADLAKLTGIVTDSEIFYSTSRESFVKFNGKYWEEKDATKLLADIHSALNVLYDNAFKAFIESVHVYDEYDSALKAVKDNANSEAKDLANVNKQYDAILKANESFILTKFSKVEKILESNKTPEDVLEYIASENAIDFLPYEENDFINFQNGTLNVKTGEFKEFDKNDKLMNALGCDYDENAECPIFDKFLKSLFDEEETGKQFLKAVASCLVKDSSSAFKKYFFLLQGPTGTGKTTLINTILKLMGSYGKASKYQTFMKTNKEYTGSQHNQDIIELIGKQFITCSEPSDTSVFAADFLKAFTGGSALSVRAAYGRKFVQFKNTGLLFMDSNFTPKIQTFDMAAMDRFQVFPILKTPKKVDTELPVKLEKELSGIFNRVYEALKSIYESPFNPSDEMINYKNQYKEESSDILQWFGETVEVSSSEKAIISYSKIYLSYEGWCDVNNKKPISKPLFTKRLKDETGFDSRRGAGGNMFVFGLEFTEVGEVYSNYKNFDKKSDFYKKIDSVTAPTDINNDKVTYRQLRQQLLTKTVSWFVDNIEIQGDYETQMDKYDSYCQYCIWNLNIPLCKNDFEAVVDYLLTQLKISDIIGMANGKTEERMLLTDNIVKINLSALKLSA